MYGCIVYCMNNGSKNHQYNRNRNHRDNDEQQLQLQLQRHATGATTTISQQCTHGSIVTDHESGEMVCTVCGSVVGIDEELAVYSGPVIEGEKYSDSAPAIMCYNSGLPSTLTRHDGTSSSTMVISLRGVSVSSAKMAGNMRRVQQWDNRIKYDGNIGMISALSLLENLKTKLSLPSHVHEKAAYIYRKAVKKGLLHGRSSVHMVAAATYVATRESAIPVSMADIVLAMCGEKEMGRKADRGFWKCACRMYRILLTELDIKMPKLDPSKLIARVTARLNIDEMVTKAVVNNARMLSSTAPDIVIGKSPLVLAAAAIYITMKELGSRSVTYKDIADAAGVTSMSIRNFCKQIHEDKKLHEKFV